MGVCDELACWGSEVAAEKEDVVLLRMPWLRLTWELCTCFLVYCGVAREDGFIDGSFLLGLLAGEVLFAEVLITPTGISKGCG